MHRCRIPECSQRHVCEGVHAIEELLSGESDLPFEENDNANEHVTGSRRQEIMIA